VIASQVAAARFTVELRSGNIVEVARSEFTLPPLPYAVRHSGEYLDDDFEGFAYGPEFNNPFERKHAD
jgi:hypothetical protein